MNWITIDDKELEPLVNALNRIDGQRTISSCIGHEIGQKAYIQFAGKWDEDFALWLLNELKKSRKLCDVYFAEILDFSSIIEYKKEDVRFVTMFRMIIDITDYEERVVLVNLITDLTKDYK
jgi:hypothetical protein